MSTTTAAKPDSAAEIQARAAMLEAIAAYQTAKTGEQDPLRASMGLLNANLMRVAVYSGEVIEAAVREVRCPTPGSELAELPTPCQRLEKLLPLLNNHLRLIGQIQRLWQHDGCFASAQAERAAKSLASAAAKLPQASAPPPPLPLPAAANPLDRFDAGQPSILATTADLARELRAGRDERIRARDRRRRK